MTQRITWIDLAKGFTILLVVFGHVIIGLFDANLYIGATQSHLLTAVQAIYLFHMPVFFALSGYFFRPINTWANLWQTIKKRSISLGIPYIAFCVMLLILFQLGGESLRNPIDWTAIFTIWKQPVGPSWFLYVLLIVMIANSLVSLAIKDIRVHVGISLGLFIIVNFRVVPIYALQMLLIWSPFFLIGSYLRQYPLKSDKRYLIGLLAVYIGYLIIWSSMNPAARVNYQAPGLIDGLMMFIAIGMAFLAFPKFNQYEQLSDVFNPIGKQSLGIYLVHIPLGSATRMTLVVFGTTNLFLHIVLGSLVAWCGTLLILKYVTPLKYVLYPLNYLPTNIKKTQ